MLFNTTPRWDEHIYIEQEQGSMVDGAQGVREVVLGQGAASCLYTLPSRQVSCMVSSSPERALQPAVAAVTGRGSSVQGGQSSSTPWAVFPPARPASEATPSAASCCCRRRWQGMATL